MLEEAALAESRHVHELLDSAARRSPDATAVSDGDGAWSYEELAIASRRLASWLTAHGVRPGNRVASVFGPSRLSAAFVFAASRVGAVSVTLAPRLKDGSITRILADADVKLVLCEAQAASRVNALVRPTCYSVVDVHWEAFEEWAQVPETIGSDPAFLVYTSGTTGDSKGVVCPHRQVLFVTAAIQERLQYRSDDVVFCAIPLLFDYALYQLFLCVRSGAHLVLHDRDSASLNVLTALAAARATVVPVVPSLASVLVGLARRAPVDTRVRLLTNTGAPLAAADILALRANFPNARVALMFGLTECKRVTIGDFDDDLVHPGSSGRALPGTEVMILDECRQRLPAHCVGELFVRGPHVMPGYWRSAELTEDRFVRSPETGEPWLRTGDYGELDDHGRFYFHGRRDELFKLRDVRVSCGEIEAAARLIPRVAEAAMLPPSQDATEVLVVVGDVSAAEVARGLAEHLETQKLPRACRVVEALPLTSNGKVDRVALRSWLSASGGHE